MAKPGTRPKLTMRSVSSTITANLRNMETKTKKVLAVKPPGPAVGDNEEIPELVHMRTLIKPDDQENLTDAELREQITRVLTTDNPYLSKSEVIYSFAQGEFVPKPAEDKPRVYILYELYGTAIRKESQEAKAQVAAGYGAISLDDSGSKKAKAKKNVEEEEEEEEEAGDEEPPEEEPEEGDDEAKEAKEGEQVDEVAETNHEAEEETNVPEVEEEPEPDDDEEEDPVVILPKVVKLANQFNFCERAALTPNYPSRTVETQTVPPPRATFSATALQSIIYDFYMEDQEKEMEKEKEADKTKKPKKKIPSLKDKTEKEIHEEQTQTRCKEAWTILERLVNQNIFDEISHDYRYWEDPSDEFRDGEGSLLPLWKFSFDRMKNSSVTTVLWNPHYHDLFAVSYGTFDFMSNQKDGCFCLFTIKNPSYPEYSVMTESPVISLDIHKKYPYLIVVGLYNGNVCVYNTQLSNDKNCQYKSDSVATKHGSLVWEVKWGPDLTDGECSFYSISGDGRVCSWAVLPSELLGSTAISLMLPPESDIPLDHHQLKGCGTCITFHPKRDEIFLVGTEEGHVHKCSKAYSRNYLGTFRAHHMPVYRIDYNKYDSNVFATCSADWRVKIWEDGREEPLFMFDLGSSVGDVKWAPYSSTVFAAATSDGKVYVFDLNINKYKPICIQNVVSKKMKKLTRIDFNYNLPIIVCGDSKGTVHLLKLSPNLRIMCKPPKKQQSLDQKTLQEMKLALLLSLVRDPPTVQEVVDEKVEEE